MRRLAPLDIVALASVMGLSVAAAVTVQTLSLSGEGDPLSSIPWPALYLLELLLVVGVYFAAASVMKRRANKDDGAADATPSRPRWLPVIVHVPLLWGTMFVHSSVTRCTTTACAQTGECELVFVDTWTPTCAVTDNRHCAKSESCAQRGDCALVNKGCRPQTAEHCSHSARCTAHGYCIFDGGACLQAEHICYVGGSKKCKKVQSAEACAAAKLCPTDAPCKPTRGLCPGNRAGAAPSASAKP